MVDSRYSFQDFMRERHAELELHLITLTPLPHRTTQHYTSVEGRELLRQHFLYWWLLEEQGLLVGAGPVNVGQADQSGLAIVRSNSREHAQTLASDEPFHQAGLNRNTVQTWQLNEGLAVPMVRALTGPTTPT